MLSVDAIYDLTATELFVTAWDDFLAPAKLNRLSYLMDAKYGRET